MVTVLQKKLLVQHTKRKVVKKSSNVLSTRQLYGWQPKSSHHDNPNLGDCNLILVGKVVHLTTLTTIRCHQGNLWQPQMSKAVKVRTLTTPTYLLTFKPKLSLWQLWQLWQLWRPKCCLHDKILMALTSLVRTHGLPLWWPFWQLINGQFSYNLLMT